MLAQNKIIKSYATFQVSFQQEPVNSNKLGIIELRFTCSSALLLIGFNLFESDKAITLNVKN